MTVNTVEGDTERYEVTDEQYRQIDRRMMDIKRRLSTKDGSLLDPEWVKQMLQALAEGRVMEVPVEVKALELVPVATLPTWRVLFDYPLENIDDFFSEATKNIFRRALWRLRDGRDYRTLGSLLVLGREWVASLEGLGKVRMQEVDDVLASIGVRLPTHVELAALEDVTAIYSLRLWSWLPYYNLGYGFPGTDQERNYWRKVEGIEPPNNPYGLDELVDPLFLA